MCAMTPSPLQVWGTKPSTTKLMAFEVQDWTHEGEDVFVDVRAKATPDRTREAVLENRRCVATKGRPEDSEIDKQGYPMLDYEEALFFGQSKFARMIRFY